MLWDYPACRLLSCHDLPPLSQGRINERQIVRFVTATISLLVPYRNAGVCEDAA